MDSPQKSSADTHEITSLFPDIKCIEKIILTDDVPVTAFGTCIPRVPSWLVLSNLFFLAMAKRKMVMNIVTSLGAVISKLIGRTTGTLIRTCSKIIYTSGISYITKTRETNLPKVELLRFHHHWEQESRSSRVDFSRIRLKDNVSSVNVVPSPIIPFVYFNGRDYRIFRVRTKLWILSV